MHHYFLKECESTQSSFKQYWSNRNAQQTELLVSCQIQHNGVGRRNNQWLSAKAGLSMSCSIPAQSQITLSPLAIATSTCEFFQTLGIDLRLKWPNDLLNTRGEKVGGILCQTLDQQNILVGIGINLSLTPDEALQLQDAPYPVGDLDYKVSDKKLLAEQIYAHLLKHNDFSASQWNARCIHLNKAVSIADDQSVLTGVFVGIDHDGAALLNNDSGRHRVLTGSLRIS
tara:strand:+ start:1354 stop:2037 length:684 start_codon:yes stop_codon:yes gene_type:complete